MSGIKSNHQQRVEEFMELAGQKIPKKPTIPNGPTRELRARLIIEEAVETTDGLGVSVCVKYDGRLLPISCDDLVFMADKPPDLKEIADGCWDSRVVVTGTLSACGIADEDGQRQVDENNLKKFKHICPECGYDQTGEHQDAVLMKTGEEFIKGPGHTVCYECGSQYISGYRRNDGKWAKGPHHKPPNIQGILDEQQKPQQER